jgi:ABC-2 type transport system permease protein
MRTILYLIRKEFLQIFRHKIMLPALFVMPFVQLIILVHAADFEIKNIKIHIINHENQNWNVRLISQFMASEHFVVNQVSNSYTLAYQQLEKREVDLILEIPKDFEKNLLKTNKASVFIGANAIDGMKAGLTTFYTNSILRSFNKNIVLEQMKIANNRSTTGIQTKTVFWYNPEMEYAHFMVPGILVILVTAIGMFFTGINIVKEKEMGTIEQINVTPIRKYQFLIGKLAPFMLLALMELAIGLTLGKLMFDIPMEGSLWLIFGFSVIYLFTILGLGLLVSTFSNTQQQAMFISWFFLMIFVLMSGLFTSIDSMPAWAQKTTWFNPVAYFIDVNRKVLLKGSEFADIRGHFIKVGLIGLVVNFFAVLNYRKTSS